MLIGIHGPARSGKDTLANLLAGSLTLRRTSFADPLKEMLIALGLSADQVYGDEIREKVDPRFDRTPRDMMQTLGTQWGRQCVHPDIWVRAMDIKIRKELNNPYFLFKGFIIPDVRFENEADYIREHGVLLHVDRQDRGEISVQGHLSEMGLGVKPGDILVDNNGTLADLEYVATDLSFALSSS